MMYLIAGIFGMPGLLFPLYVYFTVGLDDLGRILPTNLFYLACLCVTLTTEPLALVCHKVSQQSLSPLLVWVDRVVGKAASSSQLQSSPVVCTKHIAYFQEGLWENEEWKIWNAVDWKPLFLTISFHSTWVEQMGEEGRSNSWDFWFWVEVW